MRKKEPISVSSPAPLDDGGRRYNVIIIAAAVIGAILGLVTGGLKSLILCVLIGAFFGYIIKGIIISLKWYGLRQLKFKMGHTVEKTVLLQYLIERLTPMGMMVEMGSDGMPVITYQTLIYEIYFNEDQTFTIWWRKSLARAFFSFDLITLIPNYRKTVVAMGILAYHIQLFSMSLTADNADKDRMTAVDSAVNAQKRCPKCGATIKDGMKFCGSCGADLSELPPLKQLFCPNCGATYQEGTKFCGSCGAKLL